MIYQTLAAYYDALVSDDETTIFWKEKIQEQLHGSRILEYACGSGDMAIALAKDGYDVVGSDISEAMLCSAQHKNDSQQVTWLKQDMLEPMLDKEVFDGVICLCDSFNYLLKESQVSTFFQNVYEVLKVDGCFIFDTHSLDRLLEFQKEYLEEGNVLDAQYEWSILAQDEYLYQNFIFFDKDNVAHHEQHLQRIYQPSLLASLLHQAGFAFEVYTDFKTKGIHPGEKYFYVARKELK